MISVAANLAWLTPGTVGGSEEYTIRLLLAVAATPPGDIDVEVFGQPSLLQAHPRLEHCGFRPLRGPLAIRPYRIVAESTQLIRATRDADVVHHFGGRLPARRHGRDVLTIHDLQPLEQPGNFSSVKRAYLEWALPRSAAAARMICTPSDWVAESVIDRLGVDEDRVRVVSSTWDPAEFATVEGSAGERLIESLGDGPIIVYPAVSHPHKNHRVLIAAVNRLADRHRDLTLVLTGGTGRAEAEVVAAVAAARARVVRSGRIGADALRALVARADVLAFPSRYEGFGLPVLEAMRSDTPVVAADATALPGVIGEAGLLVDPDDHRAWADALDQVLTDGALRRRLVEAGRIRARNHAPAVAASRLLAVWREVA